MPGSLRRWRKENSRVQINRTKDGQEVKRWSGIQGRLSLWTLRKRANGALGQVG